MSDNKVKGCSTPAGIHDFVQGTCSVCGTTVIGVLTAQAAQDGLTVMDGPAGNGEKLIFNLADLERGCILAKPDGQIKASWANHPWGVITQAKARQVIGHLAGQY